MGSRCKSGQSLFSNPARPHNTRDRKQNPQERKSAPGIDPPPRERGRSPGGEVAHAREWGLSAGRPTGPDLPECRRSPTLRHRSPGRGGIVVALPTTIRSNPSGAAWSGIVFTRSCRPGRSWRIAKISRRQRGRADSTPTASSRRPRCVVGTWDTVARPAGQKPPTLVSTYGSNPNGAHLVLDVPRKESTPVQSPGSTRAQPARNGTVESNPSRLALCVSRRSNSSGERFNAIR